MVLPMMMHSPGRLFPYHVVFQFVILLAFLAVLWWLVRGSGKLRRVESAREVLDRRFASGELSRKEYLQMRRTLEE
ncbi:MAG: hypothetical protein HC945_01600 [Nitrosarchaeum sp.]|nr:hypothetical protein [Nitrosarchaeum sp.]